MEKKQDVEYKKRLLELEDALKKNLITAEDAMELGYLYMYFHQKDNSITAFEKVLEMKSDHVLAKIWLAEQLLMHPLVDKYRSRIMLLAKEIISSGGELSAAGYMAYAWALHAGNEKDYKVEEQIELKTKAVNAAPDWSWNHISLGGALKEAGRYSEALEHFRIGLSNRIEYDSDWLLSKEFFEDTITGRTMDYDIKEYEQKIVEMEKLIDNE